MPASYNLCILMGNLTREPELRYLSNGTPVCNFGLAVNRVYTDSNGEKQEDTCFVDIAAWNRLAEVTAQYLHKGSPALVEGRLQQRSWETEDGSKRHKLEIVARSVKFLGNGHRDAENSNDDENVPF